MGDGWTVLTFRGVPLRIQPSWLFSLAIFTVLFQGRYAAELSSVAAPISWALGLATALLLFASVLLHELGHAVMALREGVKVLSITLFHLGGVARVEKDCDTAMGSLRIAAAGPLVSLLLALGLLTAAAPSAAISPVLPLLCTQIGLLNLMLGLFNLLPGLPLDGGLILKALVWKFSGSQQRGVAVASASGRTLATLMILLGGVLLFQGGGFNGLMLMLIGWFGLGANRSQSQMLMLQKALKELRVADAAGRRFRVLESDQTLRRLSQLRLQDDQNQRGADWVLVCRAGRWLGWIDDRPLRDLPVQHWDEQRIGDHLQPLDSLPSIADKAPLWQAVQALEQSPTGRLLVLSPAGLPSGTIDRMDLGEAVFQRLGVRLPPPILEEARKRNSYPLGLVMLPQIVGSMEVSSGSSASDSPSA